MRLQNKYSLLKTNERMFHEKVVRALKNDPDNVNYQSLVQHLENMDRYIEFLEEKCCDLQNMNDFKNKYLAKQKLLGVKKWKT